jgi:hypothetical protein
MSTLRYSQRCWYALHDDPVIRVERGGHYMRILVRGCNAAKHQGCRYFTVAHACDGLPANAEGGTSIDREAFGRPGPRILAAKRFCDQLVEKFNPNQP